VATDILIRVKRPEGYEDVHPDLVMADFLANPGGFEVSLEAMAGASRKCGWCGSVVLGPCGITDCRFGEQRQGGGSNG
jgi:hypothetical protein